MSRRRTIVVPDCHGSVEHYYHFMLGYFVPLAQWVDRTGATEVTVRDCGPMTTWFDLLRPRVDIEIIAPGMMLKRVIGRHQPMAVMPPLDNPMLFDGPAMRLLADRLRASAGITPAAGAGIVVTDRGPTPKHYAVATAEVRTTGSERRSVPNMAEIARRLESVGPVARVDGADLAPREQIEVFSSAGVLVGQHGAGLANMLWMAPGSTVVEILPPVGEGVWELFGDLADALGLSYARVLQESMHADVDAAAVVAAVGSAPAPRSFAPRERARRRLLRAGKTVEVHLLRSRALRWAVRLVR